MDIGVFVIIVIIPALAALLAASANTTGLITYCSMAVLFFAAVVSIGLVTPSLARIGQARGGASFVWSAGCAAGQEPSRL